jgi:hypothetical protein
MFSLFKYLNKTSCFGYHICFIGFEVLTGVTRNSAVFWHVTLSNPIEAR